MSAERVRALLADPSVDRRLEGLALAEETGAGIAAVFGALEDDAPYAFDHGDQRMISEVRMRALVVLVALCRLNGRPFDFGPVSVRRAMSADEARERAAEAMEEAEEPGRARIAAEDFLEARVQPAARDREALLAYRILQVLGAVDYQVEEVDPETGLTPTQAEIRASQMAGERPRPHLRVADAAGNTLGFVYREVGAKRFTLDFAEDTAAEAARRFTTSIFGIERGGVPRVVFDEEGVPRTDDDGAFVLDGVVPLTCVDPKAVLRSVAAFLDRRFVTEVRR
jgi:hypothetical protein